MERVAPKADIWSFGCVLLEFLVWYVFGWDGVEQFSNARMANSSWIFPADNFFNYDKRDNTVVVKTAVKKVCIMLLHIPAATFTNYVFRNLPSFEKLQLLATSFSIFSIILKTICYS
jgi:hypothetical protein